MFFWRQIVHSKRLESDSCIALVKQLGMSNEQLEENLAALLEDVEKQRPQKKSSSLVTMVCLKDILFHFHIKVDRKITVILFVIFILYQFVQHQLMFSLYL